MKAFACAVLVLTIAPLSVHAQEAAEAGKLCLTNSCGELYGEQGQPRTIPEAISAGRAYVVRDLGGSPSQAMQAIMQRLKVRQDAREPGIEDAVENFRRFGDTSDGSTLTYTNNTNMVVPDGLTVLGAIERRGADGRVENLFLLDNGGGLWVSSPEITSVLPPGAERRGNTVILRNQ